ncbi:MAG: efflux RND transporter periplasmic adaptor subunit [Lachnospiraceae bacterium]|nr:efflux RND transporter periplasmic adaptor subunit [Lachnospiraceae bacterium]
MFLTRKKFKIGTLIALGMMSATFSALGCNTSSKEAVSASSNKDVSEVLMTSILNNTSGSQSGNITTYNTHKVATDDLSEFTYGQASFSFRESVNVEQPYSHGTVTMVKYNVSYLGGGGYIAEGTSIATLRLNIDPVAREEVRIKLEKTQAAYRNSVEKKLDSLETQQAKISTATTVYEQQLLESEYNAALESYNTYVAEQEEIIAELKEEYELYSDETMEFDIFAPASGILTYPSDYNSGDIIDYETVIATIYTLENLCVTTRNTALKYGDKVTISFTPSTQEYIFSGEVISANNVLYNTNLNTCVIAITSAQMPDFSNLNWRQMRGNLFVSLDVVKAKDALLIPTSALESTYGNSGTVTMYESGNTYKSNVKIAYQNKDYAWIVDGLNEGDEIVK